MKRSKNYDEFFKKINRAVLQKAPDIYSFYLEDLLIPKENDENIVLEINFGDKLKTPHGDKWRAWIMVWLYEKVPWIAHVLLPNKHQIIHTTFMSIDEMSELIVEIYKKIKDADHEKIKEVIDEFEEHFINLREEEVL